MDGKGGLIAGVAAGVAVIGGLLYFAMAPVEDAPAEKTARREKAENREPASKAAGAIAETAPSATSSATVPTERKKTTLEKVQMTPPKDWFESLPSGKDRTIAKNVQDALDAEDLEAMRKASAQARQSSNPEVRKAAAEALGWFGEKAVADLTGYLTDKNKDVAQAAFAAWDNAVDNLQEDKTRVQVVGMAMQVMTDKDSLAAAAAKFGAIENRLMAVDAIVEVVENGNATAASAAKEAYEHIMGEPYENAAQARGHALLRDMADKDNDAL